MFLAVVSAASGCGKKADDKAPVAKVGSAPAAGTAPAGKAATPGATPAAATGSATGAGVEAGTIAHEQGEGPAAVVTAATGMVEIRPVGALEYQAAKADAELFPGDQLRTGADATATITMADESVVEVAEVSSVAIASREGSADPASSAAVLAGLARFTVTPRAPGEGAFKVYTPGGVVLTRGTVFAVGVAVTGEARVGVESGMVDVVGLAAVDAPAIEVQAAHAATMTTGGSVDAAVAWGSDDWGAWRAESDGEAQLEAMMAAHAAALTSLEAELTVAYAELEATAAAMAELEARAAAAAEASATADYAVVAPEAAVTIDASFGVAAHLEALTWAYAGHATLATDVYVRNPDTMQARFEVMAPRVDAAVLWPKRFVVTSSAYLEPLRVQYYVHHPRGRAHAALVGIAVPEFYASVQVPEPEPVRVRARVKTRVWIAPQVLVKAQARPVWIAAPDVRWRAQVKARAAAPRGQVAWYVRSPDVKGQVLVGSAARATWKSRLAVRPPETRASLRGRWTVKPIGARIKLRAPDLDAGARARMGVKIGGDGRMDVRHHAAAAGDVKAGAGVKVVVPQVVVPQVEVKVKAQADEARMRAEAAADAAARAAAEARAQAKAAADLRVKVKIQAPPPPKLEIKGKAEIKGGVKLGN